MLQYETNVFVKFESSACHCRSALAISDSVTPMIPYQCPYWIDRASRREYALHLGQGGLVLWFRPILFTIQRTQLAPNSTV